MNEACRFARARRTILRRPHAASSPDVDPDAGFALLETVIGLFMLSLMATAIVPVLIGSLQATVGLGSRQTAITIANQALEYARSVNPSDLVDGRAQSDVAALIAVPTRADLSQDVTSGVGTGYYDPSAAAGSAAAAVPLTTVQTVGGAPYTVRTYINRCFQSLAMASGILSGAQTTCTRSPQVGGHPEYRVTVDVMWARGAGVQCQSAQTGKCEFVATTLIDNSDDPVFSTTLAPTITTVTNQSSTPPGPLTTLHPNQQVTLTIVGTNFVYGASVIAGIGDVVGAVTANTGTSMTVTLQASSVLGQRTLAVVNPNGSTASKAFIVAQSLPTVSALTPAIAKQAVAKTFTLTGTDLFATPTTAAPTRQPTITMSGTSTIAGLPVPVVATISNVVVSSPTGLTFTAIFPVLVVFPASYVTSGTLTLTDPDGGSATFPYSITVSS